MLFNKIGEYLKVKKGAFHIGGHTGEERAWYKNMGFRRVIWFEPNRELFAKLQGNVSLYRNQVAYPIGIHDTLRTAKLHIASNDGQSSSILELGTHIKEHPKVHYVRDQDITLKRMDEFIDLHKINITDYNFVNIDVQGVELNVIKSFGELINEIDYIYMEVNEEELYKGCALLPEVDKYLEDYRFKRVMTFMTKYHWGDALYVK